MLCQHHYGIRCDMMDKFEWHHLCQVNLDMREPLFCTAGAHKSTRTVLELGGGGIPHDDMFPRTASPAHALADGQLSLIHSPLRYGSIGGWMNGCCLVSGAIGGCTAVDNKGVRKFTSTITRRVGCMNLSTFAITAPSPFIQCIQQ